MASVDDIAKNTAFAQKNAATFPILSDATKATAAAYGVLRQAGYAGRVTFYIDPTGHVAAIDNDVEPLRAGAELISYFKDLGVAALD